jgi:tRNA pseudouridine32 synthase/23S rRNA pseudouridine746 synthase
VINRLETADNFMQMRVVQGAPNSHTDVLAIEQLLTKPELARYTLRPHTGKRHQLRVHMLGLGAPLMGDGIYPSFLPERDITSIGHTPLQLLAQTLEFIDPFSGQLRQFESQRDLSL